MQLKDQFVQVRFNNGIFFDAIVQEWSDQKSILRLPTTNEVVIIQKTLQDVLLVKVLAQPTKDESINEEQLPNKTELPKQQNEVAQEFEQTLQTPSSEQRLTRLSELKNELNKLERREMLGNLTSFKANGMKATSYGIPGNISINSIAQYPDQETTSPHSQLHSELQDLFAKKHQGG